MARPNRHSQTKRLAVLLPGEGYAPQLAGTIEMDAHGQLSFAYADAWMENATPHIPLSLSMPISSQRHGNKELSAFLWGVLPENPAVLDRLGRDYAISPANPIALLSIIGQDCPGAVQFVADPETFLAEPAWPAAVAWIDAAEIAARLRELRQTGNSMGRRTDDHGQFSLAGAQSKTALFRSDAGEWGVPGGRTPTTHILKPPMPDLRGQVENEHFCLRLAAYLDMAVADSMVEHFADETAIVVTRYDRREISLNGKTTCARIHQEDMCQALSVRPANKYQSDGGPPAARIASSVLERSNEPDTDKRRFMKALLFNFIILGTDAHAKNFSVLHAPGQMRLAPLYDINSLLPYQHDIHQVRMSMSIGGTAAMDDIVSRHWKREANRFGISQSQTIDDLNAMLETIPDAALMIAEECREAGLEPDMIVRLADLIAARSKDISRRYGL